MSLRQQKLKSLSSKIFAETSMTRSDIWIIKHELKVQLTLKIPWLKSVSPLTLNYRIKTQQEIYHEGTVNIHSKYMCILFRALCGKMTTNINGLPI